MEARWRVRLLGELRVTCGEHVIARLPTRKAAALLAYLAYSCPRPQPRDLLWELLWPEAEPRRGRAHLSSELHRLRRGLSGNGRSPIAPQADALLVATVDTIGLCATGLSVDAVAFQDALRAASGDRGSAERAERLAHAVDLYGGPLLPEMAEAWVLREREHLAECYYRALAQLLRHLERAGAWERALEYARRGVALDPLREEAQRDLIRLLLRAGEPAAAKRQYRELETRLRDELDAIPEAATVALLREIERAPTTLVPGSTTAPEATEEPSADLPSPGNLPHPLTRFIGREAEIRQIAAHLAASRLVTLTGAGGCGKSRLALQVSLRMSPEAARPRATTAVVARGVTSRATRAKLVAQGANSSTTAEPASAWLVELAALTDPGLVPPAVAGALGVPESPGRSLVESLAAWLRSRQILIVLDNCEHLRDACADLVRTLLQRCPGLRVLATSREPLGVAGEQVFPVPPLSLPDLPGEENGGDLLAALDRSEAVQLFRDRAGHASPSFRITPENGRTVAAICRRLDGLPLAIELAAARVRSLSVEQILERMAQRFRLLVGSTRGTLPRQQTLRASIDWSYDLLAEPERALLRRLSVFAGGFTLAAAEAVNGPETVESLTGLVDRSLVQCDAQPGEARYGLLETVREYARERLEEAGEGETARRAHREYYLAWAMSWERLSPMGREWRAGMETEHDNLRTALDGLETAGEIEKALELASVLGEFWVARGSLALCWERLAALLARSASLPPQKSKARAGVLGKAGLTGLFLGKIAQAKRYLLEGRTLAQAFDDGPLLARFLCHLGTTALYTSRFSEARSLFEEGLVVARETGDAERIAGVLCSLAVLENGLREPARARACATEALAIGQRLSDPGRVGFIRIQLGRAALTDGDLAVARAHLEQAVSELHEAGNSRAGGIARRHLGRVLLRQGETGAAERLLTAVIRNARRLGDREHLGKSLLVLAEIAHARGKIAAAREHGAEALAIYEQIGYRLGMADALRYLAGLTLEQGDARRAILLLAAAEAAQGAIGAERSPKEIADRERLLAAGRGQLGDLAFADAWAAGQALSLVEACTLVQTQGA